MLLLGLPFTENLHFTWLLPGLALLYGHGEGAALEPLASSHDRRLPDTCLPFAEMVCWSAGTSWTGRLSSSAETYCCVLALAFCRSAFFSQVATKGQTRIRWCSARAITRHEPTGSALFARRIAIAMDQVFAQR